jgi:hypothetical protein
LRERVQPSSLSIALLSGVLIGLVWEAYEYIVWTYSGKGLPVEYGPDLVLDLIMDTAGALVAVAVYRLLARSKKV